MDAVAEPPRKGLRRVLHALAHRLTHGSAKAQTLFTTNLQKQEEREISRISRPGWDRRGREDPPIPFLRGNALAYFRFCDQ
ncbi:hypothetical protein DM611_06920 [Stenotrophomonas maltophilia]|nr:hypothetical protein DM611_06920 [Stenotrophomonas maltophilia]MBA0363903.1 hypothetical protein [Stenotrophomonas maltophilia]QBL40201.1 hypothetical protein MG068_06585 [Stenotrophomonas sp. ASS1]